jgi:hypothetical protein
VSGWKRESHVFWAILNIFVGLFILLLALKPEWVWADLQRELAVRPRHVTVLKWCGAIALGVGILQLLGVLLGIL